MISFRPCPVCQKKEVELLHTITYPAGENRILPVEYQIVCCSQCGMVFDTFEADETVFDNYYSKENKYAIDNTAGSGGYSVNEKKRFQRIVNFLKSQRIDKNADIMDIGSGKGGLLYVLQENGFNNLCAVERSDKCVAYMKHNASWSVIHSGLEELGEKCYSDLIICSQIFEHLFSPRHSLEILWNVLRDEGMLLIEVPDASRYCDFFCKPYHYFDAEHINHFSLESLKMLLKSCGFNPLVFGTSEDTLFDGIIYPNCYVLCKKDSKKVLDFTSDCSILCEINSYLEKSALVYKTQMRLLEAIDSEKRCFIWGCGAYGQKLLKQGIFSKLNIAGLIDSDPSKQGFFIQGHKVYSPEIFRTEKECIVCITSAIYSAEIREQLKNMGFTGEIVTV